MRDSSPHLVKDGKTHREDVEGRRFALLVSGGVHLVLLILALLITFENQFGLRPSFIEVTLGEFEAGSPPKPLPQPMPRPTPPVQKPEPTPEPVPPKPEPKPETKPVDAPDQPKPVESEIELVTPDVPKIDPTVVPETKPEPQPVQPEPIPETESKVRVDVVPEQTPVQAKDVAEKVAEEGPGEDDELASPYSLKWEGPLGRDPLTQPLPVNSTNSSANITVRFEVSPDGRIGRILPLQKMNPELEREVMRTLRNWRFSRLPSTVPQDAQWGTITFRFVVE